MQKIIEKNRNKIHINDNSIINEENDGINQALNKLVNDDKLLNYFKNNFLEYKKKPKNLLIIISILII